MLPWRGKADSASGGGEAQIGEDYFLGDRDMSTFAVSMSLVASFISAFTTLGYPPEGIAVFLPYRMY